MWAVDENSLRQVERVLSIGSWIIVFGAVLFSVLTVTPLVMEVTPTGWEWTAPLLPLVVDTAVVIVVRLDAALARLGGHGGAWPVVLRWMTGLMTLTLNTGGSALKGDHVGVAIHSVAPLLLIVTAEAGLAYRRALAAALADHRAREVAEMRAREQAALDREHAERERERVAREAAERARREEREHQAALAREEREHAAQLAREHAEREHEHQRRLDEQQRREREQADQAREHQRRERERAQREAREKTEAAARAQREEREARQRELLDAGPATVKQDETTARRTVAAAFAAELPVRAAAELCGWSVGWVTGRYHEHRDQAADLRPLLAAAGSGSEPR